MGVIYGIAAAILFGSGDYLGGRSALDVDVRVVLLVSQCTAAIAALAFVVFVRGEPRAVDLAYGAAAGVGAAVGLGLLYRALSIGRAGVVAPLTAVVGAVVPVTWGVLVGERPSRLSTVGVVVAVIAAALVAREPSDASSQTSGAGMALGAGLALGTAFVCYAATNDQSGVWPVLSARVAAVAVIAAALLLPDFGPTVDPRGSETGPKSRGLSPRQLQLAVAAGLFDIGGTVALLAGVRSELAVLIAAVAALAPGFTVVWSWLFLHERLHRVQTVGIVLALLGLAAIAAG